VAHIYI